MDIRTYRARSLHEALSLVRSELGPDAAILHTRDAPRGPLGWLLGSRKIEVTASAEVNVPSRLPREREAVAGAALLPAAQRPAAPDRAPAAFGVDYRTKFRDDLKVETTDMNSVVEQLSKPSLPRTTVRAESGAACSAILDLTTAFDRAHPAAVKRRELPNSLFNLFTDLIDAELSEDIARELVDRARSGATSDDLDDPVLLKARIARIIEEEIGIAGPIRVTPGVRRVVALVGPTGVGKTTTIAKLAANFRLREKRRVGLVTVDTYRIAAVEQLRTYAEIIDLPMEVVSTPREMRAAIERLANVDLLLLDTAGRSPRDDVKIQELKSTLGEAEADEVHLVLSSVTSAPSLRKTAEQFSQVGATAIVLTKLDEATGLGGLLPLVRNCKLPLSYVTNGQNVPEDIEAADRRKLARLVLGIGQGAES